MQILVAMSPEARTSALALLSGGERRVLVGADLPGALTIARREVPSGIVIGDQLPAGGGLVLLQRLRSLAGTALIPVVGVGADTSAVEAFRDGGADRWLPRSAMSTNLLDAVEDICHAQRESVPLEAPAEAIQSRSRLGALARTSLVAGEADPAFDDLAWIASQLLPASTCLISMVGGEDQFFPGRTDQKPLRPGPRRTGLDESFCQWAVSSGESLVVMDARAHPLLRRNRAVAAQGVGAYAGIPLKVEGEVLGTLCALEYGPRQWDDEDLEYLRLLADCARAELQYRVGDGSDSPVRAGLVAVGELRGRTAHLETGLFQAALNRLQARFEDRT